MKEDEFVSESVLRTAAVALWMTGAIVATVIGGGALGCGAQGPKVQDDGVGDADDGGGEGAGEVAALTGGAGGAVSGAGGAGTTNASSNASSGSGSGSSSGSGGGDPGPVPKNPQGTSCSLTATNQDCADCLSEWCCDVMNECMDADLISCIGCVDCILAGDGPGCCDETIGLNAWVGECVQFNCTAWCGS